MSWHSIFDAEGAQLFRVFVQTQEGLEANIPTGGRAEPAKVENANLPPPAESDNGAVADD